MGKKNNFRMKPKRNLTVFKPSESNVFLETVFKQEYGEERMLQKTVYQTVPYRIKDQIASALRNSINANLGWLHGRCSSDYKTKNFVHHELTLCFSREVTSITD